MLLMSHGVFHKLCAHSPYGGNSHYHLAALCLLNDVLIKEVDMLGIDDPQIWIAYLLCILSTIFCIIYGISRWNKGDEPVYPEDKRWLEDEKEVENNL